MRAYLAIIKADLRLALRNRSVLFFNYIFPLIFFFVFGQFLGASQGSMAVQVVTMVLVLGVLGNGLFGAGMRAVQERETNILRRFKVAPITPLPLLVASMATGLVTFLPLVLLVLLLAGVVHGMAWPENWVSLLAMIAVGLVAFRALGLIIAAVVNSMQEASILTQILYLPMIFLSGATFPVAMLPDWLQVVSQFMPATHLATGLQGILLRQESLLDNLASVAALILTAAVATFIASRLFRWEKEEKIPNRSKAWILAVMAPFLLMGVWEAYSRDQVTKTKALYREMRRTRTTLIRQARVFVGDGSVLENASVLIEKGRIARIYPGPVPETLAAKAQIVEGAGKTLLPGLMDSAMALSWSGGLGEGGGGDVVALMKRRLAGYLYCGVTSVGSAADVLEVAARLRRDEETGEILGAGLLTCGPVFTAPGGYGAHWLAHLPPPLRVQAEGRITATPVTPTDARERVRTLKQQGADGVWVMLETAADGRLFERLDPLILAAISEEARRLGLPVIARTGDARDVRDAISAQVSAIAFGSSRELIPEPFWAEMKAKDIWFIPLLSVTEAQQEMARGGMALLERSLTRQTAPAELLEATAQTLRKRAASPDSAGGSRFSKMELARENLRRAQAAGVKIVAGSGAGNPLVFHGPSLHRELQLMVQAGLSATAALQAATNQAAALWRAAGRMGLVREGYPADLLLVDGNPLEEISATERISAVFRQGERVDRSALFEEEK